MSERVPSSQENSVYLQKQAEVLREKLAGHELFAKWRGKLWDNILNFGIEEIINGSENLTQVKNKSSKVMGELNALFRILAKFKLEGNEMAFSEMQMALHEEDYRMLGEDIPFEKTRPVTVAIFKPDLMLEVLQWMIRDDDLFVLEYFLDKNNFHDSFGDFYPIKESTKRLAEILPSLKKEKRRDGFHKVWNGELYLAIYADIVKPFLRGKNEKLRVLDGWRTLYPGKPRACSVGPPSVDEKKVISHSAVAYVFPGEQSDFLKEFSREEQGEIATWQLEVPTAVWNSRGGLPSVGIHPGSEHKLWKSLMPHNCSKGVNAGLGMVMLPDNRYISHFCESVSRDTEQEEIRAILNM